MSLSRVMTLVNQLYITSRSLSVTQVGHSEAKDPDECAHKRIATPRLKGERDCTAVPLIVPLLLTLPKLSCARVCLKGSCSQTYASRVMPPGRRGSLGSLVGLATSAGPLAHHSNLYHLYIRYTVRVEPQPGFICCIASSTAGAIK